MEDGNKITLKVRAWRRGDADKIGERILDKTGRRVVPSVVIESQTTLALCSLLNALETESRTYSNHCCREMLRDLVQQIEELGLGNFDLRTSLMAAKRTLEGSNGR